MYFCNTRYMRPDKLNTKETEILRLALLGTHTISQTAKKIGRSVPWTSLCVKRLVRLGFVELESKGVSKYLRLSSNPLGRNLTLVLHETPILNIGFLLTGCGLRILPSFLEPGNSLREVSEKSSISYETVLKKVRIWRGMGLLKPVRGSRRYSLKRSHRYLYQFVESYAAHRNERVLKESEPDGLIVWQDRNEFIFTSTNGASQKKYPAAAVNRLAQLGYPLAYTSEYFHRGSGEPQISHEEALMQSLLLTQANQRIIRMARRAVRKKDVDLDKLRHYATKYDVAGILDEGVLSVG